MTYVAHDHALLNIGGILSSQSGVHSTGVWSLDLPTLYAGGNNGTHWTRKDPTMTVSGAPLSPYVSGWGNLIYDTQTRLT